MRPSVRPGAYTSKDSVDYSKSMKTMERASAKMRFGKDLSAKKAGEMEFRKEQAVLKSNPYGKAKAKVTASKGTSTKGLGPKPKSGPKNLDKGFSVSKGKITPSPKNKDRSIPLPGMKTNPNFKGDPGFSKGANRIFPSSQKEKREELRKRTGFPERRGSDGGGIKSALQPKPKTKKSDSSLVRKGPYRPGSTPAGKKVNLPDNLRSRKPGKVTLM